MEIDTKGDLKSRARDLGESGLWSIVERESQLRLDQRREL